MSDHTCPACGVDTLLHTCACTSVEVVETPDEFWVQTLQAENADLQERLALTEGLRLAQWQRAEAAEARVAELEAGNERLRAALEVSNDRR